MFDLTVSSQDMQAIDKSSLSSKNISNKENDNRENDFSSIMEKEKKIYEKTSQEDVKNKETHKKDGLETKKTTETKEKTKEDNKLDEDVEDELIELVNSVYDLILNLKTEPEKVTEIDLESLNLKLEELSTILEQMFKAEDFQFPNEDIVKHFEGLEDLVISLKDQLGKDNMLNNKEHLKIAIDEAMVKLEEIKESLVSLDNQNSRNQEENPMNFQNKDMNKNMETVDHVKKEEIEFDQTINTKETKSKNSENGTKNISENITETPEAESEIVDVKSGSSMVEILDNTKVNQKSEVDVQNFEQIDKREVIEQIVEKIKLTVDGDKQEVKIKLKPEILGDLLLKMEVKEGSLLTKIMVDNYKTKELIEANLFQLKEEMENNSLEIKTFEVFVGSNEDFENNDREAFYFDKTPSKSKIKNDKLEELKTYDNNVFRERSTAYHEGQLNLFA